MITKAILGYGLSAVGTVALIGLSLLDRVRPTDFDGVGPLQQIGFAVAALSLLIGVTLIPLGDRPA